MSEIVLTKLDDFDKERLEEFIKIDKKGGMILTVMVDNLSTSPTSSGGGEEVGDIKSCERYNFQNFVEGREFFHSQYDFCPYPPYTYLSEDMRFLKSTLSQYGEHFHNTYLKLKKMDLEQYLSYLENIFEKSSKTSFRRRELMKDYLSTYICKFQNREEYQLFSIASSCGGEVSEFIAEGMYLFGILPTMFVRLI